jgi:xanthine dehydrogenase small subunit
MRDSVVFFLNRERQEVSGEDAFLNVSEYLRNRRGLTGTKVVCSEGDCGACTVMVSRWSGGTFGPYLTLNSCIAPVFSLDRCHLLSVEGLKGPDGLHPVQQAMVEAHGAQCGYCTPGFICSLVSAFDQVRDQARDPAGGPPGSRINEKWIRNQLTGNLCRCTGYEPILTAGLKVSPSGLPALSSASDRAVMAKEFDLLPDGPVEIPACGRKVHLAGDLPDALVFLARNPASKVISGATDLGVVANKRNLRPDSLLGLYRVAELHRIEERGNGVWIGARASLSSVERALERDFPEFSRLLHVFASPQIKNSGTLIGNLMNASPIGDTIPFLRVADAQVELRSAGGIRSVRVDEFIRPGYKQLDVLPGELVTGVWIPKTSSRFKLYKVSTRKDLDISTVAFAARYRLEGSRLADFAMALGGVGPSVLRMPSIEARLLGIDFSDAGTPAAFLAAAEAIRGEISPLSDVRGSEEYRQQLCRNLLLRFHDEVSPEVASSFTGHGAMNVAVKGASV